MPSSVRSAFEYSKTKVQISCVVTAPLISAFVFTSLTLQSLFFLISSFKHLAIPYGSSPTCFVSDPVGSRRHVFLWRGSLFVLFNVANMMVVHRISVLRLISKYRRSAPVADLLPPRRPKRRVTERNQDQQIVDTHQRNRRAVASFTARAIIGSRGHAVTAQTVRNRLPVPQELFSRPTV